MRGVSYVGVKEKRKITSRSCEYQQVSNTDEDDGCAVECKGVICRNTAGTWQRCRSTGFRGGEHELARNYSQQIAWACAVAGKVFRTREQRLVLCYSPTVLG